MAKKIERSLDRDRVGLHLQELIDRFERLVGLSRRLEIALSERADHGLDLGPDDVRVHADTAKAAELEEGENEVVVPRVQVELGSVDDSARLDEGVIRLVDRTNGRDRGELDHRLRLDVDD